MAITRSQRRASGTQPIPGNPRTGMRQQRRWTKRYRPNDVAKRHRIKDGQPKTEQVVSYTRRT